MTSESLPTAASAEHITDALRRAGVLGDGRICDVVVESSCDTILSRIVRLGLSYQGASAMPARLKHFGLTGKRQPISVIARSAATRQSPPGEPPLVRQGIAASLRSSQ
jgi:hypothetical protein